MNRRSVLAAGVLAIASRQLVSPTWAAASQAEKDWRHGVSFLGELKYRPGFEHFDYVNANAPKGGTVRQIAIGTFDNFNTVISGVKGTLAAGIDQIYDTLLVPSLDEVSSAYGLLAEAVTFPADFSSVTYRLRQEAKWHDGAFITPTDVIFSFQAFKEYSVQQSGLYRHVTKVEQTGDREITFSFDTLGNRALPQIIGQLTVLPKQWWGGTDESGRQRDIGATTLEPPLGSGAYRIKEFSPGRNIVYERVKDYWGSAINVNRGLNNFDTLRYEYFRDATVALEAFKTDAIDWRTENSAKNWATAYDFPAVRDGRVLREEFPISNVGVMQGFAFNTRREKFKDPRVRRAFNYAFNFEQMNKQMFFGQYKRVASYFEGTELAATGLPTDKEFALLETVRDKVPANLFTKPYANPVNGDAEAVRHNLREAHRLFKEAGYEIKDTRLVSRETKQPYVVELLAADPNFERVFLSYKPSLERLGIAVTVRTVDQAQYQNRLRTWDFDIITSAWAVTLPPGDELRDYWGSFAAKQSGSLNVIGINNSAVDAMIDRVISAKNWADLRAATKALDRILLWNYYVVPQWTYNKVRTARWDRFGHPEPMPEYGRAAFPALWWWVEGKATKA